MDDTTPVSCPSHGGARAGAGRPGLPGAQQYKVTLDAATHTQLVKAGGGNLSKGIRAVAQPSPVVDASATRVNQASILERVDPALVAPSTYSGRHLDAFASARFLNLKASMAHLAGNVSPALARRVPQGLELVYGHQRLQASLELGLPLLVVVVELSEMDSAVTLAVEQQADASLSAYERGTTYSRMLSRGLAPSRRRLAELVGATNTELAQALTVAELPAKVLAAFATPTAITAAMGKRLRAALDRDPIQVLERARALASKRLKASQVVSLVCALD